MDDAADAAVEVDRFIELCQDRARPSWRTGGGRAGLGVRGRGHRFLPRPHRVPPDGRVVSPLEPGDPVDARIEGEP